MKISKLIILVVAVITLLLSFSSCVDKADDYSKYSFTDISWTRRADHDVETIRFGSNGSFVYYCACGNPVNDSDLNDGYTYDDKTKTVSLSYIETTDETVSTIIIEECNSENIKLNFEGEIREFFKN